MGTSSRGGLQKTQGSQLVQPSPKPASYSFYIISVQGGETQRALGRAEVYEERHKRFLPLPPYSAP